MRQGASFEYVFWTTNQYVSQLGTFDRYKLRAGKIRLYSAQNSVLLKASSGERRAH